MSPKESAAAIENNRLLQIEHSLQQHDEGFERIAHQYSDLREGFDKMDERIVKMDEKHSRDLLQLTEAIAQLSESIKAGASRSEPVQLLTPTNTPGRLNPAATSLLGTNPIQDHIKTPPDRGHQAPTFGPGHQAPTFGPKIPRVDFPQFNGTKVWTWFQKSE
ncbi:hypothetical protein ACHQM5_015414 [Ranunculus cassubicifolius]